MGRWLACRSNFFFFFVSRRGVTLWVRHRPLLVGVFSFHPAMERPLSDWELGSIHVRSASHSDGVRAVKSTLGGCEVQGHALAWHLEQSFRDDSAGWAQAKCLQWDTLENGLPNFLEGLIDCPYVLSFFYCCLWSDHCNICSSSACRSYDPPRSGVMLGDTHFLTFDHLQYTFNGRGEYGLVSSPDKELSGQVRTEQVKLKSGALGNAMRLSSVSMREGSSDVVEGRMAEGQTGHMQVLRNQRAMSFAEQSWVDLQGVFVFSPSPESVTVMFSSGVGLEGLMALTVLLPTEFTNHTHGLLGQMKVDLSDVWGRSSQPMLRLRAS
ncbi:unnamed protein product [Merluccius merluccius]